MTSAHPLRRGMRSSPSVDNLTSRRSPTVMEQRPLSGRRRDQVRPGFSGFEKDKQAYMVRSRSFSQQTRKELMDQPRVSQVINSTRKAYGSKFKKLPFGMLDRPSSVSQMALGRPTAQKFDNTYLSAFAGSPAGGPKSPGRSSPARFLTDELAKHTTAKSSQITASNRGTTITAEMAKSLFDSATGMKMQMLRMVRDLNTNQDRSDAARDILRDLGSDPTKDHVDESIFDNYYRSVQDVKEDVGREFDEIRAEIRDTFAMLECDREMMDDDLVEIEKETIEMQRVVTKMDVAVCNIEATVGRV